MTALRRVAAPVVITWRSGAAFVARSGNIVGVSWTGVPGSAQLAALADAHRAAVEGGADVLLINHVADLTGGVRVAPSTHAEMIDLITRCRDRTGAVAHVIELPGAVGVAVRMFLHALEHRAKRGRTQTSVFDSPDAAAAWLAAIDVGRPSSRADEIAAAWRAMVGAGARDEPRSTRMHALPLGRLVVAG